MKRLSGLSVLLCVIMYATATWGQATTSLRGTVTDPSGSAIRGAQVTVVNPSTSYTRQTQTGADGTYVFVELLPATYNLTVEAKGFKKYLEAGVLLRVDLPATVNARLEVGAIAEVVSVTAEAPTLNTTDSSMGQTMGTNEIENLPLPAENAVLLLSLQPGVAFNGENILTDYYDTRAGMVNGERSDQNNISLDGVSNNNEFAGYAFNGVLPTTPFSVDEFRVTTSNYGASEGRSSGAQIALVTKGGTNQFHGSLYEFNRNGLGEANDWFLKNSQLSSGLPNRPTQLVWNNYGGAIGGPIWKNRLFFFFNYEGHRQNVGASVERAVPSPNLQDGVIIYACAPTVDNNGNVIQTSQQVCPGMTVQGTKSSHTLSPDSNYGYYGLGPAELAAMDPTGVGPSGGALAYFATYPTANDLSYGDAPNFAGYRFAAPTTTRENWYTGRLDYKLTQNGNHTLFFRGTAVDDNYGNAPFLPGRPPETKSIALSKGFVAGYTSLWGSHLVNNIRYGLTRESIGVNGNANQPWVFMRDLDQGIVYSYGDTAPVHNIVDTVDWNKGAHSFQFGFNFLLSRLNSYDYAPVFSDALTNADWIAAGGFANKNDFLNPACLAQNPGSSNCTAGVAFPAVDIGFNHAYDFPLAALMGIESEVDGSFNYKVGATSATQLGQGLPIVRHWAVDNYNLFFQDTWKVSRNLSVTYGLNYQLMTPMTETAGQEVTPTVNIGKWFNQRQKAMYAGIPDNQVLGGALIGFGPAGSVYGKPGLYSSQTKNFAPRLGIAWTPHADSGFLSKLFGEDKTSIRAGAGMYYQNFGPELAQSYSGAGEYGLSTQVSNPSGSLDLRASPRIGPNLSDMNVIPLSLLATCCQQSLIPPASFNFPDGSTPPAGSVLIAHGIDQSIKTPYSYAVNFSVQRQLPGKMTLDVAYVGHFSHRLLALDDVAAPMNLVDPKSGISYFAAARQLSSLWRQNTPESSINASTIGPTAAYWQNMLVPQSSYTLCSSGNSTTSLLEAVYDVFGPGCGNLYNETSGIFNIDYYGFPTAPQSGLLSYYNSQYSSWYTWRSIAWSNYNALQVSLNKQTSHGVTFGLNYTYSKALDVESTAERGVHYLTDSVINAWSPGQMYGPGDADLRHQINGYWVAELPFGRGKAFAGNASKLVDAIIGGWQLGGTTRWTTGFPDSVFQGYVWPTNWDEMGWSDLTGAPIKTGTTMINGVPNIFKNPAQARAGFDYAYPGESGVKNPIRGDGYFATDMNLSKRWKVTENQSFELRWSVFNVFNNVRFDAFSMSDEWDVPSSFGNYSVSLTNPRRMEFAGIYRF
ncbi:Cna B-type protein [Candidatus Sulfotelmatobacter kueseliae]|uniref:Cna B-type protein n=1 Tax=Candidatus Sulfotelmatobacter kueseliae TaxID=2042962 RepID=A0A2U3KII3_9BACT|nr:Cna B-type protein [Candidatus Sulfotelmatobacter kueseliae]